MTKYRLGIEWAYRGEFIAEQLYRGHAARVADGDQRTKLMAIADIERLTHARLQPIAGRLGITLDSAQCRAILERRMSELAGVSWQDFIKNALRDWPPYIPRFEELRALAPVDEASTMRQLVEHEVALVEFIRLEHANIGSATSIAPLSAFLGR